MVAWSKVIPEEIQKQKKKMIMCLGIIFFNEHLLRGKIKSSVFAMLDLEPVGYLSKNVK